jgi:hypothetical protein
VLRACTRRTETRRQHRPSGIPEDAFNKAETGWFELRSHLVISHWHGGNDNRSANGSGLAGVLHLGNDSLSFSAEDS